MEPETCVVRVYIHVTNRTRLYYIWFLGEFDKTHFSLAELVDPGSQSLIPCNLFYNTRVENSNLVIVTSTDRT